MKLTTSKRPRPATKALDLSALRQAVMDGRVWVKLAQVVQPAGQAAHWETDNSTDLLVHVELMPHQEPMMCRLGGCAGWRVPPVGTEVIVVFPEGDYDACGHILAVLTSGSPHASVDADTEVHSAPKMKIEATAGDTEIGATGNVKVQPTGNVELGAALGNVLINSADFAAWVTAVSAFCGGLTPPTQHASTKVKA